MDADELKEKLEQTIADLKEVMEQRKAKMEELKQEIDGLGDVYSAS